MPREINQWAMSPRSPSTNPLPESLKQEVTTKANELIETALKPRYIQPPPDNSWENYIIDIYGKWVRKAFYFIAKYKVGGPDPTVPEFEARTARMQFAGKNRFDLSYMRYNDQWVQIYLNLTVDECMEAIRDDPFFVF
jgi:hypothetical protein